MVANSAQESAMALSRQRPPADSLIGTDLSAAEIGPDHAVFNQLQRLWQWEADGTRLVRPATFQSWTSPGLRTPQ
jgi:hypothetical protein